MDEPGAGWQGRDIGESGLVQLCPRRGSHHSLPATPPTTTQPRSSACDRDPEVPATRRAQSLRGQAKPPRPRAPGRAHRAAQKKSLWRPGGRAAGTTGRRDAGCVATHRLSCAPAGGQSGTHGGHSSGQGRSSRRTKGLHWLQQRRFLAVLSPAVSVADSWGKKKSPGQQSLESLC